MRYAFQCVNQACRKEFDHYLSMQLVGTSKEPPTFCPFCGKQAQRLITVGGGFILKGHSWAGKSIKTKGDHRRRSEELEVKQYERYGLHGGAEMVPNFKGEILDSWREVKTAAESDARDRGVALDPMHEHMVFKEDALKKVTTKTQVRVPKAVVPVKPVKIAGRAKKVAS